MDIFDIDSIVKVLIRPERHIYQTAQLEIATPKNAIRQDIVLQDEKQFIKMSIISNKKSFNKAVVYLHSNSGSRLQGMPYSEYLIKQDVALVVFDFVGCGLSSGDYITLGYRQVNQTEAVIKYLIKMYPQIKICIWGRSMGAVTALRLQGYKQVVSIIADSPFSNLQDLILNIGNKITLVPKFILLIYMWVIKRKIKEIANFQLESVDTRNKGYCPAMFLVCKQDNLIPFSQMNQVYNSYIKEKQMFFITTNHNHRRNQSTIKRVLKFINTKFTLNDLKLKKNKRIGLSQNNSILNLKNLLKGNEVQQKQNKKKIQIRQQWKESNSKQNNINRQSKVTYSQQFNLSRKGSMYSYQGNKSYISHVF